MNILFENTIQTIIHHPEINTLEQLFKRESDTVFGEHYQEEMTQFLGYCQKYKPSQLIINNKEAGYAIEPEMQEWMHVHIYPQLSEAGVVRKAYVLGEDIINQLSVEQTATEDPNPLFEFNFFSDLDEGKTWLAQRLVH